MRDRARAAYLVFSGVMWGLLSFMLMIGSGGRTAGPCEAQDCSGLYACFFAGVDADKAGDRSCARQAYERALQVSGADALLTRELERRVERLR